MRLILLLAALLLAGPAWGQQRSESGVQLPRPVESNGRELLGFPPPRAPEMILEELDETNAAFEEATSTESDATIQEIHQLLARRVDLISELEESGYRGERFEPLLQRKLSDLDILVKQHLNHVNMMLGQYWEVSDRYKDSPIAVDAELMQLYAMIREMHMFDMTVSESDIERIARLEASAPERERAGTTLFHTVRDQPEEVQRRWHDWILERFPEDSGGVWRVRNTRMFGQPLTLTGVGFDGETIDTGRWKGDVILVDFWGSWCGPCIVEMPRLQGLLEEHADDGFRIVGVLCDERPDKAQRMAEENGWDWPHMVAPPDEDGHFPSRHPIAQRYGVRGFPTMWLIDRRGVLREVVDRREGVMEEQVRRLLAESGEGE